MWVIGLVALALLAAACQEDSSARPATAAAARELRAAAQRTLAEPSFRIRIDSTQGKKHDVARGEYLAPDRTHLASGGRNDRITIGYTMFERMSDPSPQPAAPDAWAGYYRAVLPRTGDQAGPGSDLTALLRPAVRKSAVVSERAGAFRMTLKRSGKFSATQLTFLIRNGRVTDATLDYTVAHVRLVQRYHYFDFGAPVSIEAPPASETRDAPTAAAPTPAPTPRCPKGDTFVPDPQTGAPSCSGPAR